MMKKTLLIQAPSKFYEAVPFFYVEAQKFGFIDKFYIATDYQGDTEVGDNCFVLPLKKDRQFSSNMLKLLDHVEEDIFFVCCEDHVFRPKNDQRIWQKCWDFVAEHKDAGYLRLTNNNRIQLEDKRQFISPVKRKDKYYVSLQPGIWRRRYFEVALRAGEDAWKFELNGAKRTRDYKKLRSYCVKETIFHHTNFFKGGKYYRHKFAEHAIDNGCILKSDRKVHWKGGYYTFEEYKPMYLERMRKAGKL